MLNTFGKSRIDCQLSEQMHLDIVRHNEEVKKNREILSRLIDIVCFLGCQELAFRGHFESSTATSCNRGNYVELANLISKFDEKLTFHLQLLSVYFWHVYHNSK